MPGRAARPSGASARFLSGTPILRCGGVLKRGRFSILSLRNSIPARWIGILIFATRRGHLGKGDDFIS